MAQTRVKIQAEIERLAAEYVRWEDSTVTARWEQGRQVKEAQDLAARAREEHRLAQAKLPREQRSDYDLATDPLHLFAARVGKGVDYVREWSQLHRGYARNELVPGASAKAHLKALQAKGADAPRWLAALVQRHGGAAVGVDTVLRELNKALATKPELGRAANVLQTRSPEEAAAVVRQVLKTNPGVLREVARDRQVRSDFDAAREQVAKEQLREMGVRPVPPRPETAAASAFFDVKANLLDAVLKLKAAQRRLADLAPSEAQVEDLTTTADRAIAYAEAIKAQLAGGDLDEQLRQLLDAGTE